MCNIDRNFAGNEKPSQIITQGEKMLEAERYGDLHIECTSWKPSRTTRWSSKGTNQFGIEKDQDWFSSQLSKQSYSIIIHAVHRPNRPDAKRKRTFSKFPNPVLAMKPHHVENNRSPSCDNLIKLEGVRSLVEILSTSRWPIYPTTLLGMIYIDNAFFWSSVASPQERVK